MPRYISDHLDAGSPGNPPKRENYADMAEYATAMRKYRMLNPTIIAPVAAPTQQTTKKVPQRPRGFADLRGSITPGSMQPAATNLGEGASMDAAERYRPGAGYPGGIPRPSDYPIAAGSGGEGGGGGGITRDNMANSSELDRYRVFVEANKEIAEKVKPGQAGYEEIQAILAEKEGGPAAVDTVAFMDDYGRSPEDAISMQSGTAEKPMSMEWNTDMPITGRSITAPIPAEGIPQKGTAMSSGSAGLVGGSTTEPISRNLLGTALEGIGQTDYKGTFTGGAFAGIGGVKAFEGQTRLLPGEIQTPDLSGTIPVDTLYASGNNVADELDAQRTIAFPTSPEVLKGEYMKKIMGRG